MKAVEIKYPTVSEANKKNRINDFAAKISLSKNQMFENENNFMIWPTGGFLN